MSSDRIVLFVLPFAGGSKYSYNALRDKMPAFIEFKAIELPGRGERITEELVSDIHALTDDIFNQIKDSIGKRKYAIYGHSMGTLLAYLLTKKIIEKGLTPPLHLLLTGSGGPSNPDRDRTRHTLSKDDFKRKLIEYGGSPKEVLENEALFDFFEPILRNDFKTVETYFYQETEPFHIPITAILGHSEKTTDEEFQLWKKESTAPVHLQKLPGGHFFIYDNLDHVILIIARALQKYI